MKSLNKFIIILIVAAVAINFYFYRTIFHYKFESEYLENWYYNSQYNVAQSTRGISDGILYQFIGFRLVQGENPFDIQYETPPLGKYLYGLTEYYFSNPFITTILIFLSSIFLFYYFAKKFFTDRTNTLIATLVFVTTPLFTLQLRETMLDLPYMFFYLISGIFFVRFLEQKKRWDLILAGIFLGLASGTKLGVYTPFISLLCMVLVLLKYRNELLHSKLRSIPSGKFFCEPFIPAASCEVFWFKNKSAVFNFLLFPLTVVLGYIFAFFEYFIRHPNPLPWLRLHQKVIDFYSSGLGTADHFSQWRNIFFINEWSLVVPLGVLAAVAGFGYAFKIKNLKLVYVSAVVLIMLAVNTMIPFSPRYLVQMTPFLVILIIFFLKRFKLLLVVIILFNGLSLFNIFTTNQLTGHSEAVARFLSTRAYRELYRSIDPKQRKNIDEKQFIKTNEQFFEGISTRKIEVKNEQALNNFESSASLDYNFKYFTKYGEVDRKVKLNFKKVYGEWRLVWNWDYIYPNYSPDTKVLVKEQNIPFLKLVDKQGLILAERGPGKTVYIIPRLMYDRGKATNALSAVTHKSSGAISATLAVNIPDDFSRFVGYLDPALGESAKQQALDIKGVSLRDNQFAQISSNVKNADDISRVLQNFLEEKPEVFYTIADVSLIDKNGNKTLLKFKDFNKKDTILELSN